MHHVQVAIPPGGEGPSRVFWRDLLGMTELDKPLDTESLADAGSAAAWKPTWW
ncbi:hypothetical protein [Streptomyces sp. GS7]|uniref:hypothetical protein n=1 Tax=Streptomyces sp. GS7 TaxID=2692234 RepID=UPI0019165D74|nr:hypothetical protein [Streptomyces sp. GS7]